jgi:glycosyltransferase involved in cell wall biosynthesis
MRVAQVMAGACAGGAELFYERLTMALSRAGEEVLPLIRRNPARAERLRSAGLEPREFRFGGHFDLRTRNEVAAALQRFRPRAVVAWMSRAARFTPAGGWVLVGRLGGFYDLSYYRHCDHLVGNTKGIVKWITGQGWPASRAHYVPNFVPDLLGIAPASLTPSSGRVLLAMGRLHRHKAFDVLIRALPWIPGADLFIAGEGPERRALAQLAWRENVSDRVHLLGWRSDTGALLAAADLLICPSRLEPLGNVVIEAWSARRPVVAAASDGPAELIEDGRTGILVAPEDSAALAKAVQELLSDRERARCLADRGRVRYEALFAEAPVVARWRNFLATVEKP